MQEQSLSRLFARTLTSLLTVLLIIALGGLATWFQVRQSQQQIIFSSVHEAVNRIDGLLEEAEEAAGHARPYLGMPCSAKLSDELNRLTIDQPHLRVISLLHGNKLVCSSFGESEPRNVDLRGYAENRLSLRHGSVITPDIPLLILLNAFPEGTIAVSIGSPHITEILSLFDRGSHLCIQVDQKVLTAEGKLIPALVENRGGYLKSKHFPYGVTYKYPASISLKQIIRQGWPILSLFVVLGGLVGAFIWYLSFRLPTPYEHLALAISRREIIPWYQPVIKSETGEIQGVEVLARWHLRSGDYIPPDVFIPQAEKSGLIIPLTRLLMDRAAADLAPVIHRMSKPFHIAFNISAAHLQAGDLIAADFCHFQTYFPSGSIQLVAEITEREPFEQTPQLEELLLNLHRQGVKIALDDFGTGYSNLRYLNTLPIDYLKIDRSFINRISDEEDSERLVDCVISMARKLGLGLVAEGVETEFQEKWLKAHGVEFLQGFYYSRPVPITHFIRMAVLQTVTHSSRP